MQSQVNKLVEASKKVILNCSKENGAILAADVFNPIYPKDVRYYGFVWLRDASFVCMAADILGIYRAPEKFFSWVNGRLEKIGGHILAHRYYPTGLIAADIQPLVVTPEDIKNKGLKQAFKAQLKIAPAYVHYQPDQLGMLLIAIKHHTEHKKVNKNYNPLIKTVANSISDFWDNDHFTIPIINLWEEFGVLPEDKKVIAYTLAMCYKGLNCAIELAEEPKKKWKEDARQMKKILDSLYQEKPEYIVSTGDFQRPLSGSVTSDIKDPSFPKKEFGKIDSSRLGLIWPSEVFDSKDKKTINTINKIIEENVKNYRVYRYKGDIYNGRENYLELDFSHSVGFWPILNFWMSIALNKMNKKEEAIKYYKKVVDSVEKYIPEQVFENKSYPSILPLCWSHAMFIIASKELGYL